MAPPFSVRSTPRFEREYRKLLRKHPDLGDRQARLWHILSTDPQNREGLYHIKKLVDVEEGQWRLRAGRFRFRYDVEGSTVVLKACALRREDTYR